MVMKTVMKHIITASHLTFLLDHRQYEGRAHVVPPNARLSIPSSRLPVANKPRSVSHCLDNSIGQGKACSLLYTQCQAGSQAWQTLVNVPAANK